MPLVAVPRPDDTYALWLVSHLFFLAEEPGISRLDLRVQYLDGRLHVVSTRAVLYGKYGSNARGVSDFG